MSFDFNNADRQSNGFELIPRGTIVPVAMMIRAGGAGEGGWLRPSNSSDAEMLDCEFKITEGKYVNRKIWQMMVVSGGSLDEKGESKGGKITRATLRAALESARNIMPDDMSETARRGRCINGWEDFCGLTFLAQFGVQKDKTGNYPDKNTIMKIITPDMKDYADGGAANNAKLEQGGATSASQPSASAVPWATAPSPASSSGSAPAAPAQPAPVSTPTPAWAR